MICAECQNLRTRRPCAECSLAITPPRPNVEHDVFRAPPDRLELNVAIAALVTAIIAAVGAFAAILLELR